MTQFLNETRERFILSIAEQVAADRIAEIHFFKPIKQGGIESGVAVVALTRHDEHGQPLEDEKHRFTVFTAHYRLTLKGLDRGKWQVNVVEEADAPLLTIETVVRGVQRRAGDVDDPERMEGDAVREVFSAAAKKAD